MAISENTTTLPAAHPSPSAAPVTLPAPGTQGAGHHAPAFGGSTLIPCLDMTFVEAKAQHDAVNAEVQRLFETGDEKAARQADEECCRIINSMLATMPATIADALAALPILTDEAIGRLDATDEQKVGPALRAATAILSAMPAETAVRAPRTALDSTVIPALGMTFTEAGARVRELFQGCNAIQGEDDESRRARNDLCEEWTGIKRAILATPPNTPADATAVLDRLLCPETGMPAGTTVQDLGALDRIRNFLAELVPAYQPACPPLDPPHQPADATGKPNDSATPPPPATNPADDGPIAAAVASFRRAHADVTDTWLRNNDDELFEGCFLFLAQRFQTALFKAGPPVSIEDALNLAGLQYDLLDNIMGDDTKGLFGARAIMVKTISDQLAHMAKRA